MQLNPNLKRKEFIHDLVSNQNIDILYLLDKLIEQNLSFNNSIFMYIFDCIAINNDKWNLLSKQKIFWKYLSFN